MKINTRNCPTLLLSMRIISTELAIWGFLKSGTTLRRITRTSSDQSALPATISDIFAMRMWVVRGSPHRDKWRGMNNTVFHKEVYIGEIYGGSVKIIN